MPMYFSRYERRDGSDRDAMAKAALQLCRAVRSEEGVRDARFFWANWDTIVTLFNAEMGVLGPDARVSSAARARASRELTDLARLTAHEVWGEAGMAEEAYNRSHQ